MTRALRIGLLSLSLLTAGAVGLVTTSSVVRAEPTVLVDATGTLRVTGEGSWRIRSADGGLDAGGFIDGKRAQLTAELSTGERGVKEAADAWKEARSAAGTVEFRDGPDVGRFIAYAAARSETEYVRALSGAGHTAVISIKVAGEPGTIDEQAFAMLETARLGKPAPPSVGAEGSKPTDEPGGETPQEAKTTTFQDVARILEITVPEDFKRRTDATKSPRREISLVGEVGTDQHAYLDVYSFPDFDRLEALGWWWILTERAGWDGARVLIDGEPPAFKVELEGQTWTRHVRLFGTDAGLWGVKLDIDSRVTDAATKFLDDLVATGVEVKKPWPTEPVPPEGFKRVEAEGVVVFAQGDAGGVDREVKIADKLVGDLLGIGNRSQRLPVVRVYADADTLAGAVNRYDVEEGRAAYWIPDKREIFTHAKVSSNADGRGELMRAVAIDAMQRRFGFRPPYWIEAGVSLQAESFGINKGSTSKPHPRLKERAQDAAGGSIDFEPVRFWTARESTGNPEREAVAWSLLQFFQDAAGRKWVKSYEAYVKRLHETMQPDLASKEFDFAEESALIEAWKKFVRKL